MGDIGSSLGERHYINLDLMLTFEKWTFPSSGYPELLQIGEADENDKPYIDAQHPHSTPLMGLTFSDTIRLGNGKDHLKLFFAPRGQATEGPIAFMHRASGLINPDAPLGHHIGQDVAHITSTVLGSSLGINKTRFEVSVFNGTEPEPAKVDLPIGKINSYAGRIIYQFTDNIYAMASAAYIKNPEPHDVEIKKLYRYSSSIYYKKRFSSEWVLENTFIFGLVNYYDHFSKLRSFGEEFLIRSMDLPHNFWGRIEVLERGATELQITGPPDPEWIKAITAGYTYDFWKNEIYKTGIGISLTKNIIPEDFQNSYGQDPLSGKIFLQFQAMKMSNW
jgi:hypothetical protein